MLPNSGRPRSKNARSLRIRLPKFGMEAVESARKTNADRSKMNRRRVQPMPLRKLFVLATLCWVAPLSAQQRSSAPDDEWGCQRERDPNAITISARDPVGEVPVQASQRAFLP